MSGLNPWHGDLGYSGGDWGNHSLLLYYLSGGDRLGKVRSVLLW